MSVLPRALALCLLAAATQGVCAPSDERLANALAAVQAEAKVISAAWNDRTIPSLLAGVADDGSRRDGYAEYLCLVLAEHGLRGGVVRVMDNFSGEWRELGKAWCSQ